MKTFLLILFSLLSINFFAQKSGTIVYKESIKLEIDMPEGNEELLKNIPTSQSFDKVLIFNENESIYENKGLPQDIDVSHEEDGSEMNIVIKSPESKVYLNTKDDTYINSQEFFGRHFLITDKIKKLEWKVLGEQKKVLDYVCIKAEAKGDDGPIVAWFAPQLAVKNGPNGFVGLPGMILALEQDGGNRTTIASSIDLKAVDPVTLVKPTKGKVVTRDEFNKMKDEKMKEMGAVQGKGGTMKMIIREERN